MLGAGEFEARLRKSKTLAGRSVDFAAMSQLLATLRGVCLGIRISDRAYGKLRIDFNGDALALADVAKPLILEVLANRGALIDDFQAWNAEVKGQTVYLGGTLSLTGLHQVLSLVDPPSPPIEPPAEAPSPGTPDAKTSTSLRYYKELRALIRDVRNPDPKRIKSTGQCAVWLDRYARKIDQLPILDVDKDLLDFGQAVAAAMRGLSFAYRGVGIRAGTYSSNPNGNRGGAYYNNNGAVCYAGANNRNLDSPSGSLGNTGLSDSQIALKIGRAYATGSEFQLWAAIDDGAAAIRRVLTERYRIEF